MAELVVNVEKECIDCPNLSLETIEILDHKIHRCEHLPFCREIRKNWEKVRGDNNE